MKRIEFLPKNIETELMVERPMPARKSTPEWFTNMPAFRGGKPELQDSGEFNITAKLCTPLADAFGMGYIQTTWADIMIEIDEDGGVRYASAGNPRVLDHRPDPTKKPTDDFHNMEFIWHGQWIPKVPKGYSVLYTHPLNREDLPFYTYSGVVESDEFYYENSANHPFLLKKGFSGIIPKGTPMFQMIPFKRDDWQSFAMPTEDHHEIKASKSRQKFWGGYKELFWKKKTFL